MTGTTIRNGDIYKVNVISIPTNNQMIRKDFNDLIFRTRRK